MNFEFTPAYLGYIKSPQWKMKCENYWSVYGRKCQACGARSDLQVHHKTYDRFGGREKLSDLCGLCTTCHKDVHSEHRRNRRLSLHLVTDRYVVKKRFQVAKSRLTG